MNLDELIEHGFIPVIDPTTPDSLAGQGANAFLAEYGGVVEEVALVCKKEDGLVTFRSGAAPSDRNYENFFTDFTELANDLGMKTHAFSYAFGDSYLGSDPNYSIGRSDGTLMTTYVDPSMEGYWKHLSQISREVARKPIRSLVLQEFLFPRQEFSFSKRAVRKFAELSGVSLDTSYLDIQKDPSIQRMFEDWRVDLISRAFRQTVENARSERPSLDIGMVVPVDPETEWQEGFIRHYGINLDRIIEICGYVIYHIMPYSPMYPEPGTPSWDALTHALRSSTLYEESGYKKALFVWGLDAEDDTTWLETLKQEVKADKIFARLEYPEKYSVKREIHRGV
ncbi:hypothetical protein CEE45_05380 [Candidatus Heimdallarchaeota archaeon B3_Heim]|nr:MAG: hypothetical protein CEE45_05380 [Candidatus Heimdallarchaeota archaeon B3_Heim]